MNLKIMIEMVDRHIDTQKTTMNTQMNGQSSLLLNQAKL